MKMADLEGLARNLLAKETGEEDIITRLTGEILDFKDTDRERARGIARAIVSEVKASLVAGDQEESVIGYSRSGVTMGEQGVGCRGTGDFFVHEILSDLSYTGGAAVLSPQDMDDAGAIHTDKGRYLVVKMEGMHSRLSDFPFLAGFHVTRAAFRDLYVKGASPGGLLVDLHLADDGDVAKLFEFMAGVSSVCEVIGCPVLGGSTLRIGGDMVIGSRLTGGVSAFGSAERLFPRRDVRRGDDIIMTEGAGGGTICTTAIYSGQPEVVQETINVDFLVAARAILNSELVDGIHCMADVTNGGIRADLHEIAKECGHGARVNESKILSLPDPRVKKLLEDRGVDVLGVSLDSLLVFCKPSISASLIAKLEEVGVKSKRIGEVEGDQVFIQGPAGEKRLLPRFRESPYTEVKRVVDVDAGDRENRRSSLWTSAEKADLKKGRIVKRLLRSIDGNEGQHD